MNHQAEIVPYGTYNFKSHVDLKSYVAPSLIVSDQVFTPSSIHVWQGAQKTCCASVPVLPQQSSESE